MYGRGGNFNFRGHKIISNKMLGFFFFVFFLTLVYKFKKKNKAKLYLFTRAAVTVPQSDWVA